MSKKDLAWYEDALQTLVRSKEQVTRSYLSEHARAEVAEARLRLLEARFEALRAIWLETNVGTNDFYISGFPDRLDQLADLFDQNIATNTRALLDPH